MIVQTSIAVRLTTAELHLLDGLARKLDCASRSDCIRMAIMRLGRYHGANCELMYIAQKEREEVRPRTSIPDQEEEEALPDTEPDIIPTSPG